MTLTAQHASSTLECIQQWKHWNAIQQVAQREYGISHRDFNELLPEYQKFLVLAGLSHGMGMFSSRVDKLWHAHVLYLKLYETFCIRYFGRVLYHTPNLHASSQEDCSTPDDICTNEDCGVCKTDPGKCVEGECDDEEGLPTAYSGGKCTVVMFLDAYRATFGEPSPDIWNMPNIKLHSKR